MLILSRKKQRKLQTCRDDIMKYINGSYVENKYKLLEQAIVAIVDIEDICKLGHIENYK